MTGTRTGHTAITRRYDTQASSGEAIGGVDDWLRKAEAEQGCRRLLKAQLRTGAHWLHGQRLVEAMRIAGLRGDSGSADVDRLEIR